MNNNQNASPYGELPTSLETEAGLLGTIMLHNKALDSVRTLVSSDDFSQPITAAIFAAMCELREGNQAITAALIGAKIGKVEGLGDEPLSAVLARWTTYQSVPAEQAPSYARIIREYANRRRVITESIDVAEKVRNVRVGLKEEVEKQISALDGVLMSENVSTAAKPKTIVLEDILMNAEDPSRMPRGITTGLEDLDRLTGGYVAGDLWIVGARPSMGKSTIAVASSRQAAAYNLADLLKLRAANGVLFETLEMTVEQTHQRLLTDMSWQYRQPIAYQKFRPSPTMKGSAFTPEELWRLREAAEDLKRLPIEVEGRPGMTIPELGARVRKWKERFERRGAPLRLVVVDHIGKMRPVRSHNGNRVNEIGEITEGLKAIAVNNDVCVLALCQLSRAVEGRENKRPQLADFRDSGHIEQDADVIGALYRHQYYVDRDPTLQAKAMEDGTDSHDFTHDLEFHVLKNRLGEIGQATLFVDMPASVVRNGAGLRSSED
ncbi:replicative DNA helicase [Microvirga sp. Mcv34]|uniref:replicative DNA helicase n=1 Tax=Microvirga sp. Mcv34 TaxID=2926016 RepID=UPI0021C9D0AF|nr:DnaB-like helicase C-terminal domain-containing protein [Microvirga sp. Mcv34]